MHKRIIIILPLFPKNTTCHFSGNLTISESVNKNITIYVTKYNKDSCQDITAHQRQSNTVIGLCENCNATKRNDLKKIKNYFILNTNAKYPQVTKLCISGIIEDIKNCIIILYDHNSIKYSETILYSDYFSKLQTMIQSVIVKKRKSVYEPKLKKPNWLVTSMFIVHLINYINLISWFLKSLKTERKITIKQGNLLLAILIDIILGYLLLELVVYDKKELSSFLMGLLEKLVNSLYTLLKWLMGAPAGLKLNNAFNKMLGNYFSYHIQLWWLFLDVSSEKLDWILNIYHYLGYFGFTFQAAMISDMICIAAFHSYCIYVYAARLFNIQVSGLIALLRLFVGRKFNPLRGSIDSCEYTNQELFVGTVAFTILLLLLPTTAMYYIVFTLCRLISLVAQYVLTKLIYIIQTLPLYAVFLWLIKSPKVAGTIIMEVANDVSSHLVLEVKLCSIPIKELVANFKPPVQILESTEWTNLLSNIITGKHVI